MSLTNNDPAKAAIVPTFTGMSLATETAIRNVLNHAAGVITGMILLWLGTHGFSEHAAQLLGLSLTDLIGGLVASVLTGGATIFWGWLQSKRSEKSLVNNTVAAALTGVVPVAIMAKASEAQAQAVSDSPTATVADIVPLPPKVTT